MKQLLIIIMLGSSIPLFCQDGDNNSSFILGAGAGNTWYRNNIFIPSGMKGPNAGLIFKYKREKRSGGVFKRIDIISLSGNYSKLANTGGEKSLDHPTSLYRGAVYAGRNFSVTGGNRLRLLIGPEAGFSAGLCINRHFYYNSFYFTPVYNEWYLSAGISALVQANAGPFVFENHFRMPALLLGRWPEFGISHVSENLGKQLTAARFVAFPDYSSPSNIFTVFLKTGKKVSLFLSWGLAYHSSDIHYVTQEYRKNTFYAGLKFN